jgi:hypothetical protein
VILRSRRIRVGVVLALNMNLSKLSLLKSNHQSRKAAQLLKRSLLKRKSK